MHSMVNELQSILDKLQSKSQSASVPYLSEETYILAIESAFNMVVITDKNGIVQYVNPAVQRITGYTREETLGKKVGLWGGLMGDVFYKKVWSTILKGETFNGDLHNHRKNGDYYTARITISPIIKDTEVIGFVGTEEDVTLEKKLQKEKEEFISLVSHQLRTPLGAMKWNLELLEDNHPNLEKEITNLSIQNQLMIDLVNRLLIVTRITDNTLKIHKEPVDIIALLISIKTHFAIRLAQNSIQLNIEGVMSTLMVNSDPALIKEILSNIIDNAIKYCHREGTVEVRIKSNKSAWTVQVLDNGIGIKPLELPLIFNKLYRGSNTISIPGTGSGMYIVNTYVHKLNGSLEVKSKLNKGTEIICTFPLE